MDKQLNGQCEGVTNENEYSKNSFSIIKVWVTDFFLYIYNKH